MTDRGQIIILNGAPRAGKSSIAKVIQATFPGNWINFGVDASMAMTPEKLQPGIGLRPGGEFPDLEPTVKQLYRAVFGSIAIHSQLGFNVVSDFGIHEGHSQPLGVLDDMRSILRGAPLLHVGVMCPLEVIMIRRNPDHELTDHQGAAGYIVPPPVRLWQYEVHRNKGYDMTVDTSRGTPEECAQMIRATLYPDEVPPEAEPGTEAPPADSQ